MGRGSEGGASPEDCAIVGEVKVKVVYSLSQVSLFCKHTELIMASAT